MNFKKKIPNVPILIIFFHSLAITGIPSGEEVVGLDIRPANGRIYIVTTGAQLYTLNTITGVATAGAALQSPCAIPATSTYAVDFNPAADRLRVISCKYNYKFLDYSIVE